MTATGLPELPKGQFWRVTKWRSGAYAYQIRAFRKVIGRFIAVPVFDCWELFRSPDGVDVAAHNALVRRAKYAEHRNPDTAILGNYPPKTFTKGLAS